MDDLEELPKVGPTTAERLQDAGYEKYADIATAGAGEMSAEVDNLGSDKAKKIIKGARSISDVGGFTTGDKALEERKEIGRITSGVDKIDEILGGGFEEKSITELFGEYKTGKSQFTHQVCVNVQLPPEHGGNGKRAIFIDTEDSYRPERIEQMIRGLDDEILQDCMDRDGVDGTPDDEEAMQEIVKIFLSRIHSATAINVNSQIMLVDDAEDICKEYRDTDFPVGLVVVDSIIGHFRAEFIGRGELANRQHKLQQHLNDLKKLSTDHNVAVILANQVQANPDQFFGDPNQASGGNVLKHRSTFRVKLRQGKKDKRVFMLQNAPNLPDKETPYIVTEAGIRKP